MKKLLLTLCTALAAFGGARADEGMWIPSLIGKNYDEMVRLGLKLTKEDLYSINQSSLKDAIVQFGGGCTAEMISANGLLITNHHCGYDAIASLSSVQKNYLDNGFWSHNMMEELPAPGLSVTFLQRIDDVTAEMTAVGKLKGAEAAAKMEETRKKIEERAAEGGRYVANVKEYFNGNQYLLLIYKRYTDVRLVATPPQKPRQVRRRHRQLDVAPPHRRLQHVPGVCRLRQRARGLRRRQRALPPEALSARFG